MRAMIRSGSFGLLLKVGIFLAALLFCEARPSQLVHGHSHGRAHRHGRALTLTLSSSDSIPSSGLTPSDEAMMKLADVAPHFDGFDRAFELSDHSSPVPRNENEVPEDITVESPTNLLSLTIPNEESIQYVAATVQSASKTSKRAIEPRLFPASSPTSPVTASITSSVCPLRNGTKYVSGDGKNYEIICDLNIVKSDLPFQLVGSFDGCVMKCDSWNANAGNTECLAVVFVPSRLDGGANDCYLKKTIDKTEASAGLVEGAILEGGVGPMPLATPTPISTPTPVRLVKLTESVSTVSTISQTFASASTVIAPQVMGSHLQGPTENRPTTQYLPQTPTTDLTLAKDLLTIGVHVELTTDYALSPDTGCLQLNSSDEGLLQNLINVPHLSRDGGKGGYLNGQHLFIFCDTGSYANTTKNSNGEFLGFVSSSVAVDVGMNGLQGNPIYLQDGIGQWSDKDGRMRGFSPLTSGEMGYNLADQANGQRYAIWPEASFIPLDAESAVLFAPVVYDNVNRATGSANFTYTGTTLLTITIDGMGEPVAERTVDRLFNQNEVEWGCVGGIRSWGSSGVGGTDGKIYVFGQSAGGLLLARTEHDTVADRNSYEYWAGGSWSSGMIPPSSGAYFLSGAILDLDIFYSPRHLTFIAVYLTKSADNTFYFRYLESDKAILPPYAKGGGPTSDYVELLTKFQWSQQQVLYQAQPGLSGRYIYSGGVHQGYYGTNDITNGGQKMLISWTAPTGQDPASFNSEYQIVTAEVDWV